MNYSKSSVIVSVDCVCVPEEQHVADSLSLIVLIAARFFDNEDPSHLGT